MKKSGANISETGGVKTQTISENGVKRLSKTKNVFLTLYQDMINGTWARKWQDYQKPGLPKHRIDHKKDGVWCTCGVGPFENMFYWSNHAKTFTGSNG